MNNKNPIGRPKTFNKDEILKIAMHYFWEHGYTGSSLDDLLLAMGIKKSSFYRTFTSKEELFSSSLVLYRKEMLNQLLALRRELGAKKTMLALTTMTLDELRNTGKVKGCLVISSGQECYNKYADLSNQITIEFNFMQELFVEFIKEAQDAGEIATMKSPKVIAGRYMNTLNGLIVSIQAGASQELIDDLISSLKEMLE